LIGHGGLCAIKSCADDKSLANNAPDAVSGSLPG
jgi:hypothetical protein